jgi:hypothetical protein
MTGRAFHQAPFAVRYSQMGDVSEGVFETLTPNHHRYGLNRPNMYVANLPPMLRYTPDYLTPNGLVEVMGIGKDKTLKIKIEKINALLKWHMTGEVHLFVYDSYRKKWWLAEIDDWFSACVSYGEMARFPDNNKEYVRLNSDNFPVEGVKYDGET